MSENLNQTETTSLNTIVILRNDFSEEGPKATSAEAESVVLRPGELGIHYINDRKVIVKAGNGTDSWNDLPQVEGVFEEDVILTFDFGKYKTSNGFVNAGGKGMTSREWLIDALSEVKEPEIKTPSYTLATGTITTDTSTLEIGSKVTKLGWNGTFNSGSYEYGSIHDNGTEDTSKATGVTATYTMTSTNAGTLAQDVDGVLTLDNPISINAVGTVSCGSITGTCEWSASDRTPVNNVGVPTTGKISAGSNTVTVNYYVTGYREGFFYGTTTDKTTTAQLNSSVIRARSKTSAAYAAGSKSVEVPIGASTVIFACPAAKTGVTKVYNNTVNAEMTSSFVKTENVMVGGADATSTSNGDYAVAYNVWTFTPNEAYGTETSLTVTLG